MKKAFLCRRLICVVEQGKTSCKLSVGEKERETRAFVLISKNYVVNKNEKNTRFQLVNAISRRLADCIYVA